MGVIDFPPEQWVELTSGKRRYFEMGRGEPCVLLHGVGYSNGGTNWFRNMGALSEEFRVIAPDMVGWGTSDRLHQPYSFAYLAEFVREFQDALGIQHSHLVGHSLGGWISALVAYESPQRVDRLALIANAGMIVEPPAGESPVSADPTRDQLKARIAAREGLTSDEIEQWTEYEWQNVNSPRHNESRQQMLEHMYFHETRAMYHLGRRLPLIKAKTLIIIGLKDATYDVDYGKNEAELIPDSELLILDGTHFMPQEIPEQINKALLSFLSD